MGLSATADAGLNRRLGSESTRTLMDIVQVTFGPGSVRCGNGVKKKKKDDFCGLDPQ